MLRRVLAAAVIALLSASPAVAGFSEIPVVSYDLRNGSGQASGGSRNYWDVSYSGMGNVTEDGALLVSGLGKLTDRVASVLPWYVTATDAGTGPDVGWVSSVTPIPFVAFRLAPPLCCYAVSVIREIMIWLDNSEVGGVAAPAEIRLNGVPVAFTPPARGSYGAVTLAGLNVLDTGRTVLEFLPQSAQFPWVFVSEVEFYGEIIVPAPSALALFALGVAGLAALRRR
ncbi:MAG: PEP-CTERM sorting domain-containing protein [Rubritepida sp.]|nr:PEP-CTERM sorting domain-containing protein [Rubritepida sp.]